MAKRAVTYHMKQPDKVPFTRTGYEQLKIRQTELLVKREIVLVSLQRAREMGDLSENGAYTAARFELGFGNKVTVELNGKEYVYTLVGTQESDPQKAMLSLESPIGMALLGKRVGEVVLVTMPDRKIEYVVRKIE